MSQSTPSDPLKKLLQAHGLQEPSAAFTNSLTRQVVAQYAAPPAEPYQAGAWLGLTILLVLGGLLALAVYQVPFPVSVVPVTCSVAVLFGTSSLLWLLKHHHKQLSVY